MYRSLVRLIRVLFISISYFGSRVKNVRLFGSFKKPKYKKSSNELTPEFRRWDCIWRLLSHCKFPRTSRKDPNHLGSRGFDKSVTFFEVPRNLHRFLDSFWEVTKKFQIRKVLTIWKNRKLFVKFYVTCPSFRKVSRNFQITWLWEFEKRTIFFGSYEELTQTIIIFFENLQKSYKYAKFRDFEKRITFFKDL